MFLKSSIRGDPNIGLYGFATDGYALLGAQPEKRARETLGVDMKLSAAMHTEFLGIFVTGNSFGVAVPEILHDYEMPHIRKHFENVLVVKSSYNAIGNLVVMNDHGIVLSPLLRKSRASFEKFFGLSSAVTTVAGINIVGSAALATNRGCIVHPRVREKEGALLERTLKVPVSVGTVNFGSHFVKAGIIANTNGFIASPNTSGPELGRISEALGFVGRE